MKVLKYRLLFIFALSLAWKAYSQDTLILIDNSIIECKVVEVKLTSIDYKKFRQPSQTIYNINKELVQYIVYNSGTIDTINPVKKPEVLYSDSTGGPDSLRTGQKKGYDAGYYDGYSDFDEKGPRNCSGVAGGLCGLPGIIAPVVYSFSSIKPATIHYPNYINNTDPAYRRGYVEGASKRRRQMAWGGYGVGVGISLGVMLILTLATY